MPRIVAQLLTAVGSTRWAWDTRLEPAVAAFDPDFVIVCAGFDSWQDDLLGCFDVTDDAFRRMTRKAQEFATWRPCSRPHDAWAHLGKMSYQRPIVPVFSQRRCLRSLSVARPAGAGRNATPPPSRTGITETPTPSTNPADRRSAPHEEPALRDRGQRRGAEHPAGRRPVDAGLRQADRAGPSASRLQPGTIGGMNGPVLLEAAGSVDALPAGRQTGNASTSSLETTERFPPLPQPSSTFRTRSFGTTGPR